ncbi:MAG: 30S ribosomal protein S20 [Myxococcales bacterium]|nr:30S ribosomal protein S20 [Myxococcales bacterium]
MANHASALKRARQNTKTRDQNRSARAATRTHVKAFVTALEEGNGAAALPIVTAKLAKAASRGVIPKKRAARKTSRLAKKLSATK